MRVSTVVHGTNADLLAAAAQLYFRPDDVVLDATYGRGVFWKQYRPANLIAHDLRLDGVDFRSLPEADRSVDVHVLDPDYTSTGTRSKSTIPGFYDRYGLGDEKGWPAIFDKVGAGMKEGARVSRRLVLVKCADQVESGERHFLSDEVAIKARELGLKKVDELILCRGKPGPQPAKSITGQEHAHQAHSFLCVFAVPDGRKPRQVVQADFSPVKKPLPTGELPVKTEFRCVVER